MENIESWNVELREIPGLRFRVRIVPDELSTPTEKYDESYADLDEIEASWSRDDWQFVGTIVTPVYMGMPCTWAKASLWGTEWGAFPGASQGREQFDVYPVPELIREALAYLKDPDKISDAIDTQQGYIEEAEANICKLGELRQKLDTVKEG